MNQMVPAPIFVTYSRNPSHIGGYYDVDDGHIYIRKNVPEYRKLFVYVHERQHKKCHDEGCVCWDKATFYSEYHAYRAELDYASLRDSPRLWKLYFRSTMNDLVKQATNLKLWGAHRKAILKVIRLKRFRKYATIHGCYTNIKLVIKRTKP